MNPNPPFIRALLSIQRDLDRAETRLCGFAERRGFTLSEGQENDLHELAGDLSYQSEELTRFLNQYLDECEAREGGE